MNRAWTAVVCPDETIDRLRKTMLLDAERLLAALGAAENGKLAGLAQQLLETARAQFDAEERRLRTAAAPSLVRHAREHQRFLADLGAMIALAARGDASGVVALKPERWIPEWLSAHARTDRDLAA